MPLSVIWRKEMENEYDARSREFGEIYEDFEAHEVANLILRAGERLAALCLDESAVDAAMKCLHHALGLEEHFPIDYTGDRSWRTLWEPSNSTNLEELPLAQRLTSLNAYAYFGLSPAQDGQNCTIEDIRSNIEAVKTAIELDSVDKTKLSDLDKTLLAAQGRLALDEDKGITPDQLAALARIELKSMRNALTPSSGSGLEVKDRAVTATSALKWLNARGEFKSSIWRVGSTSAQSAKPTVAVKGEILWVPFASDKTEFHPSTCLRAGKYTVGPKGFEETMTDYHEALGSLARMRPAPYWRRPNTVGNWGIVTAVGFHPRTAEELGLLHDQRGEK
jgi:hypothetical protein